ncbi:MAG: non-heme iron oxygenase ferredoxin subunit [Planctomycetes bacterium]|nr:non-heme iron oxygenase ferredoxin subunit [Planctomycetota bacterium]
MLAIARSSDIPEGQARVFPAEDLRIAVCRVQGRLYAVEDRCTHDDGALGAGSLDGHSIECPRHGARFDVRDGRVLRMPAAFPVRVFTVAEKDGQVLVEVEP